MGRTESVQSLDITEVTLDVVTDFKALMSAAIGIDSVYTVAKASFETLTTDSKMTEVEQANVLANLLGSMTASITNAAMGTALDKAKFEAEAAIRVAKTKQDILISMEQQDLVAAQNLKVGSDIDNVDMDKELKVIQGWGVQADLYRNSGVVIPANTDEVLLSATGIFADKGISYQQERLLIKDEDIKDKQITKHILDGWSSQIDMYVDGGYDTHDWDITNDRMARTTSDEEAASGVLSQAGMKFNQARQIQASTYATYAKSYREAGLVSYAITDNGKLESMSHALVGSQQGTTVSNPLSLLPCEQNAGGMTAAQTDVSIRQKTSFDDNVLQHVANSSATFMGMLLSGDEHESAISCIGADDGSPLASWAKAVQKMNSTGGANDAELIECPPPA